MTYWPYCASCEQPFTFDPEEPFAWCDCGMTEWGDPRPAPYVRDPAELDRTLAAFEALVRESEARDETYQRQLTDLLEQLMGLKAQNEQLTAWIRAHGEAGSGPRA